MWSNNVAAPSIYAGRYIYGIGEKEVNDGNGGGWVSGWDGEAAPATRHACLKLDSLLTAASVRVWQLRW